MRKVKRLAIKTEVVRQLSGDRLVIVNGAWWTATVLATACVDGSGCTAVSNCNYC